MAPGGGIDVVALADGKRRWSTPDGDRPLCRVGEFLLVQLDGPGPGLALRWLRLASGKRGGATVHTDVSVPLDEGVDAGIDDDLGRRFRLRVQVDGSGALGRWSELRQTVATSPSASAEWPRERSGTFRVEPGRPSPRLAVGASVTSLTPPVAPRRWLVRPRTLGGRQLAVEGGAIAKVSPVVLREFSLEGGPLAEHGLGSSAPTGAALAADGRHVLLVDSSEDNRRFRVVRLDGTVVAELAGGAAPISFLIDGGRLLLPAPREGRRVDGAWRELGPRIVSIDLEDGRERWSVALRERAYRGPHPPGP